MEHLRNNRKHRVSTLVSVNSIVTDLLTIMHQLTTNWAIRSVSIAMGVYETITERDTLADPESVELIFYEKIVKDSLLRGMAVGIDNYYVLQ